MMQSDQYDINKKKFKIKSKTLTGNSEAWLGRVLDKKLDQYLSSYQKWTKLKLGGS